MRNALSGTSTNSHTRIMASTLAGWTSQCGIRFPVNVKLAQKVSSGPLPLRGIFTERRISRGQLIAVIPHSSLITPLAATRFLQQRTTTTTTTTTSTTRSNELSDLPDGVQAAVACANFFSSVKAKEKLGAASTWFSRDQLLVVAALTQWRWLREMKQASDGMKNNDDWNRRFDTYLSSLPRRQPNWLTQQQLQQQQQQQAPELSGQPLIDRFATPLDPFPRRRPASAATGSTHQQPKFRIPTSSIDPTQCVVAGSLHLTTEQQLGVLEHAVHRAAQHFVTAFSSFSCHSAPAVPLPPDRLRDIFEWAHFIVRSRSLAPSLQLDTSRNKLHKSTFQRDDENEQQRLASENLLQRPMLIPFADMFNHSMTTSNVTACWNRSADIETSNGSRSSQHEQQQHQQDVLITATRDIDAEEELRMNYANSEQRGQFMFSPKLAPSGGGGGEGVNLEPLVHMLRAQRSAGVTEDSLSWRWQFGFDIPDDELQHTRELMWSRSLSGRIKHMMNIRRKGRPGEFVVGVPQGLASLRQQRARVERDLYQGKRIFPTQQPSSL